jgi:hypothetical protein
VGIQANGEAAVSHRFVSDRRDTALRCVVDQRFGGRFDNGVIAAAGDDKSYKASDGCSGLYVRDRNALFKLAEKRRARHAPQRWDEHRSPGVRARAGPTSALSAPADRQRCVEHLDPIAPRRAGALERAAVSTDARIEMLAARVSDSPAQSGSRSCARWAAAVAGSRPDPRSSAPERCAA